VNADGHADPRIRPRQLLEHEHVREKVSAGPAVLLRDADAHEPELGQLAEELLREAVLAVPLGRVRFDLGSGELTRQRLDLALLRAQVEVHAASIRTRFQYHICSLAENIFDMLTSWSARISSGRHADAPG
jgi:hypothetical protein